MWPFRPSQTPPDRPLVDEDLIRRVVRLEANFETLEGRWLDMRDQLTKAFQRVEKANQRAQQREEREDEARE
jgi:hypothetical protein